MIKLVPVPTGALERLAPLWWPWLSACAKHNGDKASDYVASLMAGTKQVHLLWCFKTKECRGIVGTEVLTHAHTRERTLHLIWATGKGRHDWQDLLADLEKYAREHLKCSGMKATARPGWRKHLRSHGYAVKHIIAEKAL